MNMDQPPLMKISDQHCPRSGIHTESRDNMSVISVKNTASVPYNAIKLLYVRVTVIGAKVKTSTTHA